MSASPPKFVFECLEEKCPNHKCCNRSPVMVYFEDIKRWAMDQTLNIVFSQLEYSMDAGYPMIILKKQPNETLCAMFNKETKKCNIYYSKPISCSSYPLGFNGNSFFVIDKECEGIGKGSMTKEALKEMRDRAKLDFESRTQTSATLPLLNILFMQFMQKQSQEAMGSLSEEDRKKIEEILTKEREAKTKEPETSSEKKETSEKKEPSGEAKPSEEKKSE
ncbi:MAG: YkgJ family cysteine cluster protein [Candidatus Helarchaeota archaeon]|nr:YkgJ family cysteine cluster protein [Candidatus Helarchaeota archaeon]